ncbi:hypothetical protein HDU79_011468 [Rhizoclosmatium sp. JEL0117]|nr:hypothetical protein HDU79_011468 [Rhizoclosmatium sp. JEL0117]
MRSLAASFALFAALVNAKDSIEIHCQDANESVTAEILYSTALYPDSPIIYKNSLLFAEYSADRLTFLDGSTFWRRDGCGPSGVTRYHSNSLLVACYDDNSIVQIHENGTTLARVSHSAVDSAGFLGPTDFALDSVGGVYFAAPGTYESWGPSKPATGSIHYIPKPENGVISEYIYRVASGIRYPNGIAVTSNGQSLLVSETFSNVVSSYDIFSNALIQRNFLSAPTLFVNLSQVVDGFMGPAGMKLLDGVLYQAEFEGARVLKFREDGGFVGSVEFNTPTFKNISNVWVEWDSIYVAAASEDSSGEEKPGLILRIDDPLLKTRAHLKCDITGNAVEL